MSTGHDDPPWWHKLPKGEDVRVGEYTTFKPNPIPIPDYDDHFQNMAMPSQPYTVPSNKLGFGGWPSNPCNEINIAPTPVAVTMNWHMPIERGTLAAINWALAGGLDANLYEEPSPYGGGIPRGNVFTMPMHRKTVHTFMGKEIVIVLDKVYERQAEARVSFGEKVGWVSAYLLLPTDDAEDGA